MGYCNKEMDVSCDVQFYELGEARKTSNSQSEDDEGQENLINLMPNETDEATNKNLTDSQQAFEKHLETTGAEGRPIVEQQPSRSQHMYCVHNRLFRNVCTRY